MLDLFTATIDHFAPYLGQAFRLLLPDRELLLTLEEAQLLPKRTRPNSPLLAARDSFSLIWRGPADYFLPQGQYTLNHPDPQIGLIEDLMLTPVGKNDSGFAYQAMFN